MRQAQILPYPNGRWYEEQNKGSAGGKGLRHVDRVLLRLARIYLAAAVLVILFAEASLIYRDGLAV
jgi:hypothetical protein